MNFSYNIMMSNLISLKKIYPFLKIGYIGESVLKRPIPYVKIGIGKKQILYNSAIHANEWITALLSMRFIENFAKAYVQNRKISGYKARSLHKECSLYIIPMMNPDGVDLVNGVLKKSSKEYQNIKMISKCYPKIAFPSGWKANFKGVDLKNFQPLCKVL